MFKLTAFSETDIGQVRSTNQDRAFSWVHLSSTVPLAVLLVADGMGGHYAGEEASRIAIDLVSEALVNGLQARSFKDMELLFRQAVLKANKAIYEYAIRHLGLGKSMGTTIAGVAIAGEEAVVANVGDTRVYLMGGWGLEQITVDHTMAGELVEDGYIDEDDVFEHPDRHILNRALGPGPSVKVDVERFKVEAGNRILICSDGLWGMVPDIRDMETVLERAEAPDEAVWALIDLANQNGGEDNIGVAICDIEAA